MSEHPFLRVRQLSKRFGAFTALDRIDLRPRASVPRDECADVWTAFGE